MKKGILFFFIAFLCYDSFAKDSDKTFSWETTCNIIFQNILIDLAEDDEFQSTFRDLSGEIDFRFDALEIVFNSKESFVVYTESESQHIFERNLQKLKVKTQSKVKNFLIYIDRNNRLPNNMFEYLNYMFYVVCDNQKVMHVTYRINQDLHVTDKTARPILL